MSPAGDDFVLPPARNGYRRTPFRGRGVIGYYDRHPANEWLEHVHGQIQAALLLNESRCSVTWRTPDGTAHLLEVTQPFVWLVPENVPHGLVCAEDATMVTLFLQRSFVLGTLGREVLAFASMPLEQLRSRDLVAGQIISVFEQLCLRQEPESPLYLESLATMLGAHLLRTVVGPPPSRRAGLAPEMLRKLMDHIDAHLAEPLPLDDLARFIGMCRSRLTERFKATVGVGVHQYIVQRRVSHAKHLLETTDLKELHIAHLCGFSDDTLMARAFRRVLHCTPSSVRHRQRSVRVAE